MFSVLFHAGLVARHNQTVLAVALAHGVTFDLSVVCGNVLADDAGTANLPAQDKTSYKCPICAGAAPAMALADITLPVLDTPQFAGQALGVTARRIAPRVVTALPPSRAPPAWA